MVSNPRIQTAFGQVLKELRNERGLSQQQLAFDSDLDRTYISLLERGLRLPTLGTVFRIANALNLRMIIGAENGASTDYSRRFWIIWKVESGSVDSIRGQTVDYC